VGKSKVYARYIIYVRVILKTKITCGAMLKSLSIAVEISSVSQSSNPIA